MAKYLKLFDTQAEYETFIQTDFDRPNVSYCKDNDDVHYNPYIDTRLVCNYNVTSTSEPTVLMSNKNIFKSMEIDGVMLDELVTKYTFDTTGIHTVKYELYDETNLGNDAFYRCTSLISIDIPDSITSIGYSAFYNCSSLTSVIIPNGVTSIGYEAFYNCSSLTSITIPDSVKSIDSLAFQYCSMLKSLILGSGVTSIGDSAFCCCRGLTSVRSLAMTAPTIDNSTFQGVKTNGTLYVPIGSSGYDVWIGTGDYYLGKYNWTKVEQ